MKKGTRVVYTGPIDRYFDYAHGKLTWRSVRFEIERLCIDDYQGTAVMNFAEAKVPYTRIHEPKHLHLERPLESQGFSHHPRIPSGQYPQEPDYPVNFDSDRELDFKYECLPRLMRNVLFGGD